MKKLLTISLALLFSASSFSQEQLPYQNANLSPQQRAEDLLGRLTLREKISLMMDSSPAIPRLGIPQFQWWNEALHGVARNGTATVFPNTTGMAASWDDDLLFDIYDAVSDEARAKAQIAKKSNRINRYQSLSFWTPNINIFRDPRWGRGQETYGEDPYLTARMGIAVVRGLQGSDDLNYRKTLACAKHFAVHSGPEWNRHSFNVENLPERDLWETYLPAFKALVQEAGVEEVMCAYQSIDGDPCCGNNRILRQILRDDWGFKGLVTSDCWAISDFYKPNAHHVVDTEHAASAMAVRAGTDLECGSSYASLTEAVSAGEVTEKEIDESLMRLLVARIKLGDLDPDDMVEWTKIPESVIGSDEHKQLARQMAREGIVLLQNRNDVLPLQKSGQKIVVLGANANDSTMLWGNYNGTPTHTETILSGIQQKSAEVTYIPGLGLTNNNMTQSRFDRIASPDGRAGVRARYYNNEEMAGDPVSTQYYTTPLRLTNGGATVFAPNVNLEHFSATYEGTLGAEQDETVNFNLSADDGARLIVNGDTLFDRYRSPLPTSPRGGAPFGQMPFPSFAGAGTNNTNVIPQAGAPSGQGTPPRGSRWGAIRRVSIPVKVKAGEAVQFKLDYRQNEDVASLQFDLNSTVQMSMETVKQQIAQADVVVYVGGISPRLEGEEMRVEVDGFKGGDRTHIELPKVQRDFLAEIHGMGKPVVFVNCSGGAVGLVPETQSCDAILQAWYGGEQGGTALADVLFGDYNPSGKLPLTFYRNVDQLPDFLDYTMKGRTYRYMTEQPLFPFGYGLSYTTFDITKVKYRKGGVTCTVTNTGDKAGDEVVQVYLRRQGDTDGPVKTLRAFRRVHLEPGEKQKVDVPLPATSFEWWDDNTNTVHYLPGTYDLMVGSDSNAPVVKAIKVK